MPRAFEAATLSRMRSPITSRSNWPKLSRMLSVSRPMDVVVQKFCVTETKVTPCASNRSIRRTKSVSDRDSRSSL